MYESFYGLREKPFSLLPDSRFLYASRTHRVAMNLLDYGLAELAGFVVLTGEVGTGKTTLLRHLLHQVGEETVIGLVSNTHRSFGELMKWILQAFGLDFRDKDAVEQHGVFLEHLIERYAQGQRVVLIVDEAQNLGPEALEQLRMLSNVNAEADHLLQLILVGQPELRATLQRPELRQFAQRIAVDYHLEPLTQAETAAYVRHRLAVAGGHPGLFDDDACAAVGWFARGIPRLINSLADLALVWAFADGRTAVSLDTVLEAAHERSKGGLAAFARLDDDATLEQAKVLILSGPRDEHAQNREDGSSSPVPAPGGILIRP